MTCFSIYTLIMFLFLLWRIYSLTVVIDELVDTVQYLEGLTYKNERKIISMRRKIPNKPASIVIESRKS